MKNKLLTKKVLCSVLAASVFGTCGVVFAAETTDNDLVINEQIRVNKSTGDKSYTDKDSLTVIDVTDETFQGALQAENDKTITISNVGTVNIGTAENRLKGAAIHAQSGFIDIEAIDDVNIYTGKNGILGQYASDNKNAVNITAGGNITIDADTYAVMAATMTNGKGTATVNLSAGDKVIINSGQYAISVYDQDGNKPEWHGENKAQAIISGKNGVSINSETSAIYMNRVHSANDGILSITSESGDVVITSKDDTIIMKKADKLEGALSKADITGQNVTIKSDTGSAVNLANGALTFASNTTDGNITLTGADVAVEASGNSQLTLGDAEKANNVIINGRIEASDSAAISTTENATLVVDAKYLAADNDNAFITTNGSGDVSVGGNLKVTNAKTGDTLKFTDNETLNGELTDKVISSNVLQDIVKGEDGTFTVGTVSSEEAEKALAGAVITNVALQATEDNMDAITALFNGADQSQESKVAALNSVANMGELAGVNHGTYSMSNQMTDAVADHLSIATHSEQDNDIWAHYIHNKEDIDGMNLGGVDGNYEAQYNGIVIGSDLYKNGKTTAGIALSYADGNINGSNSVSSTKNDAEYYGASLYGRIDNGNSAILGDISYMHSDNDITQNNSGHEITASADADAFSIGIRAEQAYEAGAGKFVPYAGIRYMHLGAGNYENSLGMSYDADDQNLWLLPVGVTYSAEVQSGDWTVKPIAEVGYVWTMGDRDTDQTVSLNGASDTFGFETADSGSFIGRLGIEAEKANVTYGLGYEYQKGDTVKANKWMANLTFSF